MSFPPGSLVKRPLGGILGWFYSHMGVYVGDGQVIHFNGEGKDATAVLCHETLEAFSLGRRVQLHAAPKNAVHGRAVCAEAERQYRDSRNSFNHRYHFAFRNCEDFCVACYQVQYSM